MLRNECTYVKNSLNGTYKSWYKSGKLDEQSNYVMSRLEGKLVEYNTMGHIKAIEYYQGGDLDSAVTYHSKGQLSSKRTFQGGQVVESHCYATNGKNTVCNVYNFQALFKSTEYASHIDYFKEKFQRPNIRKSKM